MIKDIMDIIRQKYQQKWMYDKNKIEIARYTHQRLNVGISIFINIQTFANWKSQLDIWVGVRKISHFVSEIGGSSYEKGRPMAGNLRY